MEPLSEYIVISQDTLYIQAGLIPASFFIDLCRRVGEAFPLTFAEGNKNTCMQQLRLLYTT